MKIILVCAGGFSTTMMMNSIKKTIENSQKLDIKDFIAMEAIPVDHLESKIDQFDIVLLGPQVGHKKEEIQKLADQYNKPILVLPADAYGLMDGAAILKLALITYHKYQNK